MRVGRYLQTSAGHQGLRNFFLLNLFSRNHQIGGETQPKSDFCLIFSFNQKDLILPIVCIKSFLNYNFIQFTFTLVYSKRAYSRYEAAIALMVEIGDRKGQIEVLSGMAKSLVLMKQLAKENSVCECQVCSDSDFRFFIRSRFTYKYIIRRSI